MSLILINFEICALKMQLKSTYLLVLCIYRSPSGDFSYFLTQLEMALNKFGFHGSVHHVDFSK